MQAMSEHRNHTNEKQELEETVYITAVSDEI